MLPVGGLNPATEAMTERRRVSYERSDLEGESDISQLHVKINAPFKIAYLIHDDDTLSRLSFHAVSDCKSGLRKFQNFRSCRFRNFLVQNSGILDNVKKRNFKGKRYLASMELDLLPTRATKL